MDLGEELVPHVVFTVGPLQVTNTVVHTWIIMAIVSVLFIVLGRRLKVRPTRFQNALEWGVEALDNLIEGLIPHQPRVFLPIVGTLAIFIAASNLGGLIPGLKSPTTDLNTPLAMAIVVFFSVHYYGIRAKGIIGHLKHYVEPIFIMLPIEIASELARTMSLTFRLFGNILGEEIVIAVLFLITMLTVVYLSGAVQAHK